MFNFGYISFLNTNLTFGVDGTSIFFILLTSLIGPLLILSSWYLNVNTKLLILIILISELFTLLTFTALDLFVFFIVFECLLLPLFVSIVLWGSSDRKIKAAFMLFIYTIFSSLLFIVAIFTIYLEVGSTNFFSLFLYSNLGFSFFKQKFLWLLLFIAFAIKLPLYPFHTWLPEAHVEAPTFGSVILASLLLKTGGYGLFRFVIPHFSEANIYFTPLVYTLGLIGVIYGAFAAIRQLDLKRIIAYLSVSHMNFCVLGQFSESIEGLIGSLLLMIAHGIIAAGLFISIGYLYKRYKVRTITYYGGLARVMPLFSTFMFIFTLGNMNMPGTSNFIGELLILIGVGHISLYITLISAIGSAVGSLCSIWLWTKIMFGDIKTTYLTKFKDLSRKEFYILLPLILINFTIGIFTNEYIDTIYVSIYFLYNNIVI
jgi:proton-translocating NADH-quinone oxidoreductase chain M